MSTNNNNNFQSTFFIVPSYILDLPGLTMGYLKVYETIFQFWNKNLPCYLSNQTISDRTGMEIRQIQYALDFFESSGEMTRVQRGMKRFLVRREQSVEIDCSENTQGCTPVHGGVHSSAREGCTPVHHNIKKLNKESKDNINKEPSSENEQKFEIKPNPYVDSTYDTAYKTSERTDHFHEPNPNEPFERFCKAYPTMKDKPMCKQLWLQANLDDKIEDILFKLKEQIEKDSQWLDGFWPNSLKYIKSEGWNDDIRLAPTKKSSSQNKQQNMTDGKPSYFDNTSTEWIKKVGVW